jgi:hypothetical protein
MNKKTTSSSSSSSSSKERKLPPQLEHLEVPLVEIIESTILNKDSTQIVTFDGISYLLYLMLNLKFISYYTTIYIFDRHCRIRVC